MNTLLSRYIDREIYYSMFAFLGIFLVILSVNYLIHFLEDAASGSSSVAVAFKLLMLMLPQMLGVLLPISLFLGILSSVGKLFASNELLIALCSGISFVRLWKIALRPIFVVTLVVAIIVIFIQPLMDYYQASLRSSLARGNSSLSMIQAGNFVSLKWGNEVVYLGGHTSDNSSVYNVFVYLLDEETHTFRIIAAPFGSVAKDPETHQPAMTLENGYQYEQGNQGLNYQITQFDRYRFPVPSSITPVSHLEVDATPTWRLFHQSSSEARSELMWRFSIPMAAFVLGLFAISLGYVKPRQGRFGKFLPALFLFIIYFNSLVIVRTWIENGKIPSTIGFFTVHGVFFLAALFLLLWRDKAFEIRKKSKGGEADAPV